MSVFVFSFCSWRWSCLVLKFRLDGGSDYGYFLKVCMHVCFGLDCFVVMVVVADTIVEIGWGS